MTREEALAIIEESRTSYVLDPMHSYLLNALVKWNSLLHPDALNSLKWEGEGGMDGLFDRLNERRTHAQEVDKTRIEIAVAMTMMLSQISEPEQMVAVAYGIEDVVYAVRGFERKKRPGVTVIVGEKE